MKWIAEDRWGVKSMSISREDEDQFTAILLFKISQNSAKEKYGENMYFTQEGIEWVKRADHTGWWWYCRW